MLSTKERSSTSQEGASIHSSVYPLPNMSHEKLVSASSPMPPLTHLFLTGDNLNKTVLAKVSPHEHLWMYFKPLPATQVWSVSTAELAAGLQSYYNMVEFSRKVIPNWRATKYLLHPLCKWQGTDSQLSVSDQQSNFDRVKVSQDCDLPKDVC